MRHILSFPAVAAMLRLGSKYDFVQLREEALLRLRFEFPSTLQEWDRLPSEYTHILEQKGILFDIINLALEQGIVSILPPAYYLCIEDIVSQVFKQYASLKYQQNEIFLGEMRDDGSITHLPPETQRACILGKEKILTEQANATLAWLDNEFISDDCFNPKQCTNVCSGLLVSIYKPMPEPCRSLEKWEMVRKGLLCTICREEAERIHEAGRQKMWDMMPQNFGFPPWTELKKLDR